MTLEVLLINLGMSEEEFKKRSLILMNNTQKIFSDLDPCQVTAFLREAIKAKLDDRFEEYTESLNTEYIAKLLLFTIEYEQLFIGPIGFVFLWWHIRQHENEKGMSKAKNFMNKVEEILSSSDSPHDIAEKLNSLSEIDISIVCEDNIVKSTGDKQIPRDIAHELRRQGFQVPADFVE